MATAESQLEDPRTPIEVYDGHPLWGSHQDRNVMERDRIAAIDEIWKRMTEIEDMDREPGCPAFLAATLQFCDLAKVQDLAKLEAKELGKTFVGYVKYSGVFSAWRQVLKAERKAAKAVRADVADKPERGSRDHWVQSLGGHGKDRTSTVTNFDKQPEKRSGPAVQLAKKRDGDGDENGLCVLQRSSYPQAAHIFPACLLRGDPLNPGDRYSIHRAELFEYWHEFFSSSAAEWEQIINDLKETKNNEFNHCANLICLSPSAHESWNRGEFSLKPLDEDGSDTQRLQLFWQAPKYRPDEEWVDFRDPAAPTGDLKGFQRKGENRMSQMLTNMTTQKPVFSGTVIPLKTANPKKMPLPKKRLLDLAHSMQRMVAMAGAGEDDSDDEPDFDEWEFAARTRSGNQAQFSTKETLSDDDVDSFGRKSLDEGSDSEKEKSLSSKSSPEQEHARLAGGASKTVVTLPSLAATADNAGGSCIEPVDGKQGEQGEQSEQVASSDMVVAYRDNGGSTDSV